MPRWAVKKTKKKLTTVVIVHRFNQVKFCPGQTEEAEEE